MKDSDTKLLLHFNDNSQMVQFLTAIEWIKELVAKPDKVTTAEMWVKGFTLCVDDNLVLNNDGKFHSVIVGTNWDGAVEK